MNSSSVGKSSFSAAAAVTEVTNEGVSPQSLVPVPNDVTDVRPRQGIRLEWAHPTRHMFMDNIPLS